MAKMVSDTFLEVRKLSKTYGRGSRRISALDAVSFTVAAQATVAIVGSSGSGKSTLARCIAHREEPDSGTILFAGRDITALRGRELRRWRRSVQLLPQDPGASLNPRFSATAIVGEPFCIGGIGGIRTPSRQREASFELMSAVGLPTPSASRLPGEFSGGQRARLALARAVAADPRLLILDETLSALDLALRASLIKLLRDLQLRRSLTYIVITHDLGLAGDMADEILVMDSGRIVESGPATAILGHPRHPQTQRLLAAVPGRA